MLFDKVIAFDNLEEKIILIVNIQTDDFEKNYEVGVKELEIMSRLINDGEIKNLKDRCLKQSLNRFLMPANTAQWWKEQSVISVRETFFRRLFQTD